MKSSAFHFNHTTGVLVVSLLILAMTSVYAADKSNPGKTPSKETYREFVDEIALPINGTAAIKAKVQYPRAALLAGLEGKVIAKVYIDESGKVNDVQFIKKVGGGLEDAVKKVLMDTRFSPALDDGRPVKAVTVLKFEFKIN